MEISRNFSSAIAINFYKKALKMTIREVIFSYILRRQNMKEIIVLGVKFTAYAIIACILGSIAIGSLLV